MAVYVQAVMLTSIVAEDIVAAGNARLHRVVWPKELRVHQPPPYAVLDLAERMLIMIAILAVPWDRAVRVKQQNHIQIVMMRMQMQNRVKQGVLRQIVETAVLTTIVSEEIRIAEQHFIIGVVRVATNVMEAHVMGFIRPDKRVVEEEMHMQEHRLPTGT